MAITAVVFDLGGVITRTPFVGVYTYETEAGLPEGSIVRHFRSGEIVEKVYTGERSMRDFFKEVGTKIQQEHGVRIDLRRLGALAAESGAVRPEMVDLLRDLHGRYALGLLTNNARETSVRRDGIELPTKLFDAVVESQEVGLMKPDPRIYLAMLDALGRAPEETAFVDDFEENLPPAEALGMRTIRFVDPEQCRHDLAAIGVR